ncbi:MAG: class I SAM-dependent methyltransferase [Gemmatimonadota bacterium]
MKPPHWDLDEIFDSSYLAFYEEMLGPERTSADCDRILELLDVSSGARLLDLCCGHGRHAGELASRGLWVVGVDRSSGFLRRARSDGTTRAQFLLSDVTALPIAEAAVDGAYCWFSSIGYGEAENDRRLLKEAWRVLRPGARLVVELRNLEMIEPGSTVTIDTPRGRIVDRISLDEGRMRIVTQRRYEPIAEDPRDVSFSLRLYTASEFAAMFEEAGFVDLRALGEENEPLREGDRRIAFVGRRPGEDP